jgi:hypothetical protein
MLQATVPGLQALQLVAVAICAPRSSLCVCHGSAIEAATCCGAGVVARRQLPGSEGAVLQLQQWGNLLLYVTQQGGVHAWDLRMREDAWLLRTQPSQGIAEQLVADPTGEQQRS